MGVTLTDQIGLYLKHREICVCPLIDVIILLVHLIGRVTWLKFSRDLISLTAVYT